ncbi:MAG: hypothetical protein R3E95_22250 [Thiolinea sp.]
MGSAKTAPPTLEEIKQRLLNLEDQARKPDYLAPVRRYPLASASAAFLAGMAWHRYGMKKPPPGALTLAWRLLTKL